MSFKKIILVCVSILTLNAVAQKTFSVSAGAYQKICPGAQAFLGGHPTAQGGGTHCQYTWHPGKYLNDSTSANPIASLTVTTTYTVSVIDSAGAEKLDTVTIYIYPYYISAGKDTSLKGGQTITLHGLASGDSAVYWAPEGAIYNQSTLSPDVFPLSTTNYTLTVGFPHGCILYDTVRVTVIPSTELYFYNSFTPNGDGANDYFYIGNIGLYPNNTLQIYNRYGQLIHSETGYNNDWKGSYLGTDTPAGTYFYILDTHDTPGKFKGEVTIIR